MKGGTMLPPQAVATLKERFSGTVKANEPLGQYTSWKIGGPADLLAFPHSREDLHALLVIADELGVPLRVLGAGSNLLIADEGCRGIVVKLSGPLAQFSGVVPRGQSITVFAGGACTLPRLVRETIRRSLRGLEFAEGIPGSVGGACRLNAGAYGVTIGALVESIVGMTLDGKETIIDGSDVAWGYRTTSLPADLIILSVVFRVHPGSADEADTLAKSYREKRRKSQPLSCYTAGSVFRNPPEGSAGRLIEEAGCKGLSVGDAMVAAEHANFLVNCGKATAGQMRELMALVVARVKERSGVTLVPEVEEWGALPEGWSR
jgi:UDP-N-acetylmuramate dehydrogenase